MKRALGAEKLPTKLYVFPLIDNKNSREQEKLENKTRKETTNNIERKCVRVRQIFDFLITNFIKTWCVTLSGP